MEWIFIQKVMEKMGFSETWIKWIMWCVSSIKYQVLLNSQPRGNIVPQRGLRQGDSLSLVSLLKNSYEEWVVYRKIWILGVMEYPLPDFRYYGIWAQYRKMTSLRLENQGSLNIHHLIWQIASGYLTVTRNLTRLHMRCDNHFPRCGEANELINHAILECPPTLQSWAFLRHHRVQTFFLYRACTPI